MGSSFPVLPVLDIDNEAFAEAAASSSEPYESELRDLVNQRSDTDSLFKNFFNFRVCLFIPLPYPPPLHVCLLTLGMDCLLYFAPAANLPEVRGSA